MAELNWGVSWAVSSNTCSLLPFGCPLDSYTAQALRGQLSPPFERCMQLLNPNLTRRCSSFVSSFEIALFPNVSCASLCSSSRADLKVSHGVQEVQGATG